MPNDCYNKLTITGDREQLKQFLDCGIDFNTAIPYPEYFRQMDEAAERWKTEHPGESWMNAPKDGFNSGGYEWCIEHWGTKWNAYSVDRKVSVTVYRVEYTFETAWSPPILVVAAWSAKFPDLEFRLFYYEPLMDFQGTYVVKGGKELENTVGPCSDENEN
jgi:hypothetical protein